MFLIVYGDTIITDKSKSILTLIVSSIIVLVISLIIMQLIDWPKRPVSGWTSCKDPDECNYLGLRGREIEYTDEDFVVILLGDSETQAWNFSFLEMPERIL